MEINAISTDLAVRRYLDTRDSEARKHFREDTDAFAHSKSEYDEAVRDTEDREASDRVGELYEEHRSLGEGLMDRQDEQDELLAEISREFDRMDTKFDDDLQANLGSEGPDAIEKARQAVELELDVVEVNAWFGTFLRVPSEENRKLLLEDIDDFRSEFAEFAALDLTPVEREAADDLASSFEANAAKIVSAVAQSDALERDLTEFTDLRGQIDAVLDEEVQVVARSELQEAGKVADSAADQTQVALLVMLVVGLVVGAGAAYFISRGIISSLNKLVEGANRIGGGSLEHRISIRSQDETGALAVAFNEMAEKRQNAEGELARLAHRNTLLLDSAGEGIFGLTLRVVLPSPTRPPPRCSATRPRNSWARTCTTSCTTRSPTGLLTL
jgi:HAMP domain-containing protein